MTSELKRNRSLDFGSEIGDIPPNKKSRHESDKPYHEATFTAEEYTRRVEKLEERHEALEDDCSTLNERQEQTDVDIGDLFTDVIELKNGYEEVMEQIPDVCEELKGDMEDTLKKDIHEFKDSMAKQIVECVDEMKGKLRQALQ
ncbi:hypothetical protein CSUB01_11499 [Colletotrichum sublineola]|uniref:Uncharacterized protein n=1 Tax=Colletotrichum sublineola TaxID=1173701 RepID=A0A066XQG8_COLSU|nr:hypothetical protein CSUB01_11499 [Colletotrichum sublineola]